MAPQEKLRGSANKRLFIRLAKPFSQWQYKYTAQCFQCVQSYFDPGKLISKNINCKSERGDDLFLFLSEITQILGIITRYQALFT